MKRLFTGALLIAICMLSQKPAVSANENYLVCESKECQARATLMKEYMDKTIDGCTDFYAHSCNGWLQTHSGKGNGYGISDMLQGKTQETLKDIIENTHIPEDNQNVAHKALLLYKQCVGFPRKHNKKEMWQKLFTEAGLSAWPITTETAGKNQGKSVADVLSDLGIFQLFDVYVRRLPKDKSHFLQLHFVPVTRRRYNIHLKEYKNSHRDSVIRNVLTDIKTTITDEGIAKFTEDIAQFEYDLHRMVNDDSCLSVHYQFNQMFVYNKPNAVTKCFGTKQPIRSLEESYKNIPLSAGLKKMFSDVNVTISDEEIVSIHTLGYYKGINEFLQSSTPNLAEKIQDYAGVRAILALTGDWQKLHNLLRDKPDHWKDCLDLVKDEMPDVISYIYANHSFPPGAREQVKLIADKIKTAFTEMVSTSEWMSDETKQKLKEKINSITSTFGYSDNLFNMSVLGRRYEHIPNLPLESSFLDILAAVRKNRKLNELKLLREEETQDVITVIRRDLKDCDHKSFRSDDHLVFPMEFFREPFFTYNLPWSLNFGSFGSVFAHQLLHRLHLGVHPDPDTGYYNVKSCDLFVGNDGNKCSEKTQCFLSQYKNAIEPMFNKTSEQYLSTLQENIKKLISRMISDGYPSNLERSMPGYIGDNSGINLVLKAYKTLLQEECDNTETRLKGLEGYSSMQLLFFARAMASCGIMKGEKLPFWMVDNQHSPYEYRVNLPMQNSAAFAEAFHCEENTKMYRKESERCTFW